MATDGRFGLPLMIKGDMKQKKLFSGVFVGQLRDNPKKAKEGLLFFYSGRLARVSLFALRYGLKLGGSYGPNEPGDEILTGVRGDINALFEPWGDDLASTV